MTSLVTAYIAGGAGNDADGCCCNPSRTTTHSRRAGRCVNAQGIAECLAAKPSSPDLLAWQDWSKANEMQDSMEPREKEQAVLDHCLRAASGDIVPRDKAQADVFRYAAMLLTTRYPDAAKNLWAAHEVFYASHAGQPEAYAELRHRVGLSELGRFHDMLVHRIREQSHGA